MKIVAISDTHNHDISLLELPAGDVLIHAGDWTNRGSLVEVSRFNQFCADVKDRYTHGIFVVPGNHDFLAQKEASLCRATLTNCTMLIDQEATIGGKRFYFSPHSPIFFDWAFMEEEDKLVRIFSGIPDGLDVLVTHTPPYGVLDEVQEDFKVKYLGCSALLDAIQDKKPKVHIFGHIHQGYGARRLADTQFINASLCDERYSPVNRPIIVELPEGESHG